MATVLVNPAAGADADQLTLDVDEVQGLVAIDGVDEDFEYHIFLVSIEGSRWIVGDSDCTLAVFDIAAEEVVPLGRRAA